MFSLVGRAVGYLLGGGGPPPPNEEEIVSQLPSAAVRETRTLYGLVTEMKEDYGLVDDRYCCVFNRSSSNVLSTV